MALKATLSKEDHAALADGLKALYVERGGKFVLDAEGVEDVSGLKSALDKEREGRELTNKELKAIRDKYGDLDPEKAREALKQAQELADKKLLDAGKIDELLAAKTEQMKAEFQNQLKAKDSRIKELETNLGSATTSLKKLTINSRVKDLAVQKGARPEAIDDVLARFTMIGIDGIVWDMDGDKVVAKKDGQIKYGKSASDSMTFEEGLELLATKAPHLFGENAGGGANNGQPRQQGSNIVLGRDQARDPQAYRAAKAAAEKGGGQVTIQ